MKYLRIFLLAGIFLLGAFFVVEVLFAQTPEDEAKKLGIAFPISDLGNCANVSACKTYCEQPGNHEACTAFARKHGFDKHPEPERDILADAKSQLGCDSEASCRAICEDPATRQKCIDFAKRHGMEHQTAGPPTDVLAAAKKELGCDSAESCLKYCESEANRAKCQSFASKQGFGGAPPPGGDYDKFCGENPDKCKQGRLSGPGGCDSQESCKKYCEEHPAECGYQPPEGSYSPPPGSYTPPPESSPYPTYSPYPEVQGTATKSIWQSITDFFFGFLGR